VNNVERVSRLDRLAETLKSAAAIASDLRLDDLSDQLFALADAIHENY
jgi:hypothetical protein